MLILSVCEASHLHRFFAHEIIICSNNIKRMQSDDAFARDTEELGRKEASILNIFSERYTVYFRVGISWQVMNYLNAHCCKRLVALDSIRIMP
jgi:hypothetical protein